MLERVARLNVLKNNRVSISANEEKQMYFAEVINTKQYELDLVLKMM